MPSVLFICTQNRFRSPLAAAMFSRCLEKGGIAGKYVVASAGTWAAAGAPAHPSAVEVARAYGLSLADHRSRPVTAELLRWADLVLGMEQGHLEAIRVEFEGAGKRLRLLSEVAEGTPYDLPDIDIGNNAQTLSLGEEVCRMVERSYRSICELAARLHLEEGTQDR